MAATIPNTTVTTNAPNWQTLIAPSGGTGFANGFLYISNNSVELQIFQGPNATQAQGAPIIVPAPPGIYPLTGTPADPARGKFQSNLIYGVQVRNPQGLSPTTAQQILGVLYQPGEISVLPSNSLSSILSSSGGVTGGGSVQLGYLEKTTDTTLNGVNFAGGTTYLTLPAITFDGSTAVWCEHYFSFWQALAVAATEIHLALDGVDQGIIWFENTLGAGVYQGGVVKRKITPTSGSHVVSIVGFASGNTLVRAGAGGAGVTVPTYLSVYTA